MEGIEIIQTAAPNYGLSNSDIVAEIAQWRSDAEFRIVRASVDSIEIVFDRLPSDLAEFCRRVHEFCPDVIDQGTGTYLEAVELLEDEDPEGAEVLKSKFGLQQGMSPIDLLATNLQQTKRLNLWWD